MRKYGCIYVYIFVCTGEYIFSFTRTLRPFRLEKLIENEKIQLARETMPSLCATLMMISGYSRTAWFSLLMSDDQIKKLAQSQTLTIQVV